MAKLTPGDELELKDNRIGDGRRGQPQTDGIAWPEQRYRVETLPIALIGALVNRSFQPTPARR